MLATVTSMVYPEVKVKTEEIDVTCTATPVLLQVKSDMSYDLCDPSPSPLQVKVKTKGDKTDLSAGSDEAWNPVQQKALEKALKQFPKGTDQRWDKIARAVPDKTKVRMTMVMIVTVMMMIVLFIRQVVYHCHFLLISNF